MTYTATYTYDDTGWWFVAIDGIEGCHSQGRTLESARSGIREALGLFIDDAQNAEIVDSIRIGRPPNGAPLLRPLTPDDVAILQRAAPFNARQARKELAARRRAARAGAATPAPPMTDREAWTELASLVPRAFSDQPPCVQEALIRAFQTEAARADDAAQLAPLVEEEVVNLSGSLPDYKIAPRRKIVRFEDADEMTADDKSDAAALKRDGRERKDDLTIDDLRAWSRNLRKQGEE